MATVNSQKAILVLPYFGSWGPWFDLFLATAGRQDRLDVLLITNSSLPPRLPSNIYVIRSTLGDFQQFAEDTLGTRVALTTPYKLCDLRPMYGYLFAERIRQYKFWAFGDEDILYGDFSNLLAGEMNSDTAVITAYPYSLHVAGPLTLIINSEEGRLLFTHGTHWRQALADDRHWGFDEISWFKAYNDDNRHSSFDGAVRRAMVDGLKARWGFPHAASLMARTSAFEYAGGAVYLVWRGAERSLSILSLASLKEPGLLPIS